MRYRIFYLLLLLVFLFSCQNPQKVVEDKIPLFRKVDMVQLGYNCNDEEAIDFAAQLQESYNTLKGNVKMSKEQYKAMIKEQCEQLKSFRDIKHIATKVEKAKDSKDTVILTSTYKAIFMKDKNVMINITYFLKVKDGKVNLQDLSLKLYDIQKSE